MTRRECVLVAIAIAVSACGNSDANSDPSASTEDPVGGPYPVADLSFVVEHPELDTIEYRLTCLGDTATVSPGVDDVDGHTACLALTDADVVSRLVGGPPTDPVCSEEYGGPHVVTITGTIDERPVDTTVDRTNGCGITDWDELLADLVPPVGVTE